MGSEQALIEQKVKFKILHNVTIYIMNALLLSRRYSLRLALKHSQRHGLTHGLKPSHNPPIAPKGEPQDTLSLMKIHGRHGRDGRVF